MKLLISMFLILGLALACSKEQSKSANGQEQAAEVNPNGVGTIDHVDLNDPLDQEMVKRGKGIYDMKCASCHKLSGPRVVGPSFKGVTQRRTPAWIMNMITNTEAMLEQDPEARKMLEECLTRMPNQNLSTGDARDVLEYLFQNDLN